MKRTNSRIESKDHELIDIHQSQAASEAISSSKQLPPRPRRFKFILDIFLSSCADSTVHGVSLTLKQTNWFIRIVWIVCFLTSAVACVYMIIQNFVTYLAFETVSKSEKVHLTATDFPAVTLCNINPFLTNESIGFVNEIILKNKLLDEENLTVSYYYLTAQEYSFFRFFVGTNALDPTRNDSFRKSLGPDISDMLLSCSFNMIECSADDFTWYFDSLYGNCFTFNSGI